MLYTIPGPLQQVVALGPGSPRGWSEWELSDGAPRGLEQVKAERAEILAIADSLILRSSRGRTCTVGTHGRGLERDARPRVA